MKKKTEDIEKRRSVIQTSLDRERTQLERNKLGQYATPYNLAKEIVEYGIDILNQESKIRFLDPAVGTGVFYSALLDLTSKDKIENAVGYDIDPHYGHSAIELWTDKGLKTYIKDFTQEAPQSKFNLLISNPPYVRHHHIDSLDKTRLQHTSKEVSGLKISGLAGLYCYFLLIAHNWMEDGGIAGWLIPSEFMDVNYGSAIKEYLLKSVTLLHIHRFDPIEGQFSDAMVSSTVVWFRKTPAVADHNVKFTFGGSLLKPKNVRNVSSSELKKEKKWTRFPILEVRDNSLSSTIGDLFKIKRGIATGCNKFFILSEGDIKRRKLPLSEFRPILPSSRYIVGDLVKADCSGVPKDIPRLYLLDTALTEDEIKQKYPSLWLYFQEGKLLNMDKGFLCRGRKPWYSQEKRPPAPIVCTYMGRSKSAGRKPFRFILNESKATITNGYLAMYPTRKLLHALENQPDLISSMWMQLNNISSDDLLGEGRIYGGGLHKLEPKELANVPINIDHAALNMVSLKEKKSRELTLATE